MSIQSTAIKALPPSPQSPRPPSSLLPPSKICPTLHSSFALALFLSFVFSAILLAWSLSRKPQPYPWCFKLNNSSYHFQPTASAICWTSALLHLAIQCTLNSSLCFFQAFFRAEKSHPDKNINFCSFPTHYLYCFYYQNKSPTTARRVLRLSPFRPLLKPRSIIIIWISQELPCSVKNIACLGHVPRKVCPASAAVLSLGN